MSVDTSDSNGTSVTELETSTSNKSESGVVHLIFSSNTQTDKGCDLYRSSINAVFTQMSSTQGIKKHCEKTIAAIFKELKQPNDGVMPGKPVIESIPFSDYTQKDKEDALESVIKEKRCGKLKG